MADSTTNPLDWYVNSGFGNVTVTPGTQTYTITTTSNTAGVATINPNMPMTASINPNMVFSGGTGLASWSGTTVNWNEVTPMQEAVPSDPWEAAIHKASQMMKNG